MECSLSELSNTTDLTTVFSCITLHDTNNAEVFYSIKSVITFGHPRWSRDCVATGNFTNLAKPEPVSFCDFYREKRNTVTVAAVFEYHMYKS